jgi:hypothetical protein
MATVDGTQAILGVQQGSPKILLQHPVGTNNYNLVGGSTVAPGKFRWITSLISDTDANQAASITAGLVA